jgi:hypothetical protein
MTNEPPDVKNLWQSQEVEGTNMPLEEIRRKAGKFQRRINLRNLREYVAAAIVAGIFALYVKWFPNFLMRAGSVLTIFAALYISYQIYRKGSANVLPQDCDFDCCIDFHRRELERQRDLLRRIWRWYLGPFIPGMLLFFLGTQFAAHPPFPHHGLSFAWELAVAAIVLVLIAKLNERAANRLQRQIDNLETLAKPPAGGN